MSKSAAEYDGFLAGLSDIRLGRWDIDNAIPPSRHWSQEKSWLLGYSRANDVDRSPSPTTEQS